MNPYVFFVGCTRSGTTLLRRIADAHPELAVLPEQQWLPRYAEWGIGVARDGTVTPDLLDMLLADRRFAALELPFREVAGIVEKGPPKSYSDFVTALFDLYGRVHQKRLVGEKTPKYVRHVRTLHRLWPDAKFVHLIRDGRDVALSLLEWDKSERNVGRFPTWDEDPLMTAALYWDWNVRLGRESGEALGADLYHELRYEALVADPEVECREVCSFLGVEYQPAMLRFHEGRTQSTPGLSAKKSWQPITPGLRSWREDMADRDVARFDAAAGALLNELGYERAQRPPTAADRERADRLRAEFMTHARPRQAGVPRAWQAVAT